MKIALFITFTFLVSVATAESLSKNASTDLNKKHTASYSVSGMTCSSCVKSIREKICNAPSVIDCNVKFGEVALSSKDPGYIKSENIQKLLNQLGNYKIIEDLKSK